MVWFGICQCVVVLYSCSVIMLWEESAFSLKTALAFTFSDQICNLKLIDPILYCQINGYFHEMVVSLQITWYICIKSSQMSNNEIT